MDTAKALIRYMQLRDRRNRLAHNPPDTKATKFERFSEMEAEQLRLAEVALSRLSGTAAIELLIANRANVLDVLR